MYLSRGKAVVMVGDPAPNLTIEKAKAYIKNISNEQNLADIYAVVDNKATWVRHDPYDYEDGTEEYIKACEISDEWDSLEDDLRKRIFDILKGENVKIPERGQIAVLIPFMERNGYRDGAGWWIEKN